MYYAVSRIEHMVIIVPFALPCSLQIKEKEIATKLKWNLNAVTAADFIEELSRRLSSLLMKTTLDKLIDHCHTLANICLLSEYAFRYALNHKPGGSF